MVTKAELNYLGRVFRSHSLSPTEQESFFSAIKQRDMIYHPTPGGDSHRIFVRRQNYNQTNDTEPRPACPRCKDHHVIKHGFDKYGVQLYMCKTCSYSFKSHRDKKSAPKRSIKSDKANDTAVKVTPKETAEQKEIRQLNEQLVEIKKKVSELGKEINRLRKENENLKINGVFPKGLPVKYKSKTVNSRFADIDM